jgi:tetratricopeptide (TPR) repeat protein
MPILPNSAAAATAQRSPSPESLLELSLAYHRAGRFQDCITAPKAALRLRPDYAEAYNNIAAGYQSLGMWDEAIQAASEALRIKPDFQVARNNQAYSQAQKRAARVE